MQDGHFVKNERSPVCVHIDGRCRWRWTRRLAAFFAILLGTIQFLIGLYAVITLPPPPTADESFGLAVMQGSVITALAGALLGAMLGSLIDIVASNRGDRRQIVLSTVVSE